MKRCPECGREYDNTMMFCLDDGTELLYGPASGSGVSDEPATAILHSTAAPGEAPTRAQIHTTEQATVLLPGAESRRGLDDMPERRSLSAHRAAKPLITLGLALIVLVGGFFVYRYYKPAAGKQINSIAVLPFENNSGNADSDYLSDGLTETLIYRLSQIPNLKVSARSLVFRYKGQQTDMEKIAAELGVDAVMSGRIVQRGDSLTISVDLTDVRNKKSLWGEQYERKLSDLLATQREIATEIVNNLKVKLSGESEKALAKSYTDDNEAYQLYLKGRYYWNKRNVENIRKSIEEFKAAADKDPKFALAYVGLADAQILSVYYTRGSESELIPQARANARRALEIDDSLGEAHATLGIVNEFSWDHVEAEKEFKRSIELNPHYAIVRLWYSRFLRSHGRYDEALAQIKKGYEEDSLSLPISGNLAEILMEQGDVNGAIEQNNKTLEIDPNYWAAHQGLAYGYLKLGRNAEALAQVQKIAELLNGDSIALFNLGYIQAILGNRAEALSIVKKLEEKYVRNQASGADVAAVYVGLGEKDKAFEWLEKDFRSHASSLAHMRLEIPFDSLRDDPRFVDLLKRITSH